MEKCAPCKFWSEMVAGSVPTGGVEALCLNPESPFYQQYTQDGCEHLEEGTSIDCPSLRYTERVA